MNYFIDTEFSERGPDHPIEIISLAMAVGDGGSGYWRLLYLVNSDFDADRANDWVRSNVLPHVDPPGWFRDDYELRNRDRYELCPVASFADQIRRFVGDDPSPTFWGYYADYDYVVFSQLFGGMSGYPAHWPYLFRDLRQLLDDCGATSVSQPETDTHHALTDAIWIGNTYKRYANRRQAA